VTIQLEASENPLEKAGYLELSGAHLYTVLHHVPDPIARILLVGPFASERHFSYVPWVRWARFLASKGIEALRYDYRGVGESTGAFEDMSLDHWSEDVAFLAHWLRRRSPDVPLILHGLELGALLASRIFETGVGDALLLWSAPDNANDVLRAALLRRIAIDHAFKDVNGGKTWSDYIGQFEANQSIDVEGYPLSARLWRESVRFELPFGKDEHARSEWACGRPVRAVKLGSREAPLVKGSSFGYVSLNPDLSGLFAENCEWFVTALAASRVVKQQ
jgi:hypothetical protein